MANRVLGVNIATEEAGFRWVKEQRTTERRYSKEFIVGGDGTGRTISIYGTPGLPRIGDYFFDDRGGFDLSARCYDLQITEYNDDQDVYIVRADYSTDTSPDSEEDQPPENQPPQYEMTTEFDQVPFRVDLNNLPVVTSAGERIDFVIPVPVLVFRIWRILTEFPEEHYDYIDSANQAAWWSGKYAAGRAVLERIEDRPIDQDGRKLREAVYTVRVKTGKNPPNIVGVGAGKAGLDADQEFVFPPDEGTQYIDPEAFPNVFVAAARTGDFADRGWVALDGFGQPLADQNDRVHRSFKRRELKDWTTLDIDGPF